MDPTSSGSKAEPSAALVDTFGRTITYLRVSVTDRCDLRCVYCMSEQMSFLPKRDLLSLDELDRLCSAFVRRGIRKIRLTGGEPLVRRNVMDLFRKLSRHLESGALTELTLTTNGTQLAKHACELAALGVRRVNVSLDSLDEDRYRQITRWGDLKATLKGLDEAQAAGLSVKLNVVALRGVNEDELEDLLLFAHRRNADMTLIESMPMGDIGVHRADQYLPLSIVRARLMSRFTFDEDDFSTGGPARYVLVRETGRRLGFITPLTHNFCESCNRVRVSCTGTIYSCLGQDNAFDLRGPLRADPTDRLLQHTIDAAILDKPRGHDFVIDRRLSDPSISRHMNVTGG
ncbi:GTP 3',8-cyclase MoaA [Hyphomicrobium sp.]|uniref:GTP 3',8-cyclase MoaA n=1 Tax=Hyphomicrobium sp. TaxID=82 RepID=UPI002FE3EF02